MAAMLFRYQYRDAANFKAAGEIVLTGSLRDEENDAICIKFSPDGLFIAEQLDVPPLYEKLYQWSDGPTSYDHCWHELVELCLIDETKRPLRTSIWGSANDFLMRVLAIDEWNECLSPHGQVFQTSFGSSISGNRHRV